MANNGEVARAGRYKRITVPAPITEEIRGIDDLQSDVRREQGRATLATQ